MDLQFNIYAEPRLFIPAREAVPGLPAPYCDASVLTRHSSRTPIPVQVPMAVVCQMSATFLDPDLSVIRLIPRVATGPYTRPRLVSGQLFLRDTIVDKFNATTTEGMGHLLTSLLPRAYDQLLLTYGQETMTMLSELSDQKLWPAGQDRSNCRALQAMITHIRDQTLALQSARHSAANTNAWLRSIAAAPQS
jgi:hypothetical protein